MALGTDNSVVLHGSHSCGQLCHGAPGPSCSHLCSSARWSFQGKAADAKQCVNKVSPYAYTKVGHRAEGFTATFSLIFIHAEQNLIPLGRPFGHLTDLHLKRIVCLYSMKLAVYSIKVVCHIDLVSFPSKHFNLSYTFTHTCCTVYKVVIPTNVFRLHMCTVVALGTVILILVLEKCKTDWQKNYW